jgi:hypothetical protein
MAEFDKTKKAIGLNSIDDSLRKDMFEKFQSAGGKIVKDKPGDKESPKKDRPQPNVRQSTVSRNDSDRSGSGRSSSSSSSNRFSGADSKQAGGKSNVDANLAYEKEISSFGARFSIKLKCWFARVTPFGSPEITPACMGIFARDLKSALMEFQMAGAELLSNSSISSKITKSLDQVNPQFVEIIGLGHKLYKSTEINELTEPYNSSPDSAIYISRVKDPIYSIFKKLYVLYPYQDMFRKAFVLAYENLQKHEGKPAMIYNSRKKKILQEVDNLFGTIYEKMYLVVIRNENKNIPMVSKYMENILGITIDDKPGKRKSGEGLNDDSFENKSSNPDKSDADEEDKENEKKPEVNIPKEMAYGLRLMKMYNIENLRKKFDPRGELVNIPDSDKALLTYLFFKEFDDNYSFVMTTKKIDIKQVHVNGNRVDYRQKLVDQYETARNGIDQFRIYMDTFKEFASHKANPGSNYIEASKKTTALETKRSQHSRNVRVTAKEFMEKTRDLLLILINDMKSKREIIGNMDEVMNFDSVESRKRLNKKPIKQCIMESYCYSLALAERLESGDLYGGVVELNPDEMKESFGIEVPDENKQKAVNTKEVDESIDNPPEESSNVGSTNQTESTPSNTSDVTSDGFDVEY